MSIYIKLQLVLFTYPPEIVIYWFIGKIHNIEKEKSLLFIYLHRIITFNILYY